MATEQGTETVTVTKSTRTWRVEIFCERGNDPVVRAHREIIRVGDDGTVLSAERGITVDRLLSQIADEDVDGITGAALAGHIAKRADLWHEQDVAARAAAEERTRQATVQKKGK